ncbi:MAG: CapA family protein [Geobacter sp.]|nr:CapA family protein [Geobacter sp.]
MSSMINSFANQIIRHYLVALAVSIVNLSAMSAASMKQLRIFFLLLCLPSLLWAEPVTIHAVGDIMLAGSGARAYRKQGYSYPFAAVSERLRQADIVIGNLEAPLTTGGEEFLGKKFRFKVEPAALEAIKDSGFTHLALANNHILDYGPTGLQQTIQALDAAGVAYFGAGADLGAARKAWLTEVKGVKIAFLSYSLVYPEEFFATNSRAGTAPGYRPYYSEDIRLARSRADYVVVSFHWGEEGAKQPKPYQQAAARKAIDAGADVVLGHHPHVLQGVEYYGKGVIFYSLGNFAFGSMSRNSAASMIARIILDDGVKGVEVIPLDVLNSRVRFQPKILSGKRGQEAVAEIGRLSEPFGSRITSADEGYFVTVPLVSTSDRIRP